MITQSLLATACVVSLMYFIQDQTVGALLTLLGASCAFTMYVEQSL
jgi:hypothetical protein